MKAMITVFSLFLFAFSTVGAVPALQLFVDDGYYDWDTETWIYSGQTDFDLYIVGNPQNDEDEVEHVRLIVSSDSQTEPTDTITINGIQYPEMQWIYGTPCFMQQMPPHGIFPAWYFMIDAGEFHQIGGVGDVVPDSNGNFFDPSEGYVNGSNQSGEIRLFSIEVGNEISDLHFDAVAVDDGEIEAFAPFSHDAGYTAEGQTGVYYQSTLPTNTALLSSYPNPFNAETTIKFSLPEASDIGLEIFDLQGRLVSVVADGSHNAGTYSVIWDGKNNSGKTVASGRYLVRLRTADAVVTRQVMLLK